MTPLEITKLIVADLDSRGLKNPNIRKNALKKVLEYMRNAGEFLINESIVLPYNKSDFKERLTRIKGYDLNSAESSVINMIYLYIDSSSSISNLPPRNIPQAPIEQLAAKNALSHPMDIEEIEKILLV